MTLKPPKEKGGIVTAARLERSNYTSKLFYRNSRVNHTREQWRGEATRLLAEYYRTKNPAHLRALRVHRAAMGGRIGKAATR